MQLSSFVKKVKQAGADQVKCVNKKMSCCDVFDFPPGRDTVEPS